MSVLPKPAVRPQSVPLPSPMPQGVAPAHAAVAGAIQRAADSTGASFEYLLATAKVESNLDPTVKASTSSATGLFQFIEQTWLGMLKQTGRALGFADYADAISQTSTGQYEVHDARLRNEILQLRTDPQANATMAGAFTRQNAAMLNQRIGRAPSDGELYMAHVFGPHGAAQLIGAAAETPQASAAAMFPAAARANRSIFYDRQGQARSVAAVHAEIERRFRAARVDVAPAVATAAPVPDTAGMAQAFAAAAAQPSAPSPQMDPPKPDFRSLFHAGEVRGPVAPMVSELWAAPGVRPPPAEPRPTNAPSPLHFFQDSQPDARGLFRPGRT